MEEHKINQTPDNIEGFSIASMVLGIISLVFFCLWFISIPCGILAIIFGAKSLNGPKKGMATAGLVTGIVALSILVILFIF